MRTGIGYDIHRLIPTVDPSAIFLGGVSIPCYFKIHSKSDGDVLLHALTDACLGALALGDIAQWFSEGKTENRPLTGSEMVREVMLHIQRMGWRLAQFDSVVIAEEPKLFPHGDEIRRQIARLVGSELSSISVKVKTTDCMGPNGERKAIAAHTVVTLERTT